MKKTVTLALGALLIVSLAGCDGMHSSKMKNGEKNSETPVEITEVTIETTEISPESFDKLVKRLNDAYLREFAAGARCNAWAEKAEKDGWKHAASVFRAVAKSESVHADQHARALKALGETPVANVEIPEGASLSEMLKKSIESEKETISKFYPELMSDLKTLLPAKAHGVVKNCETALKNDEQHLELFQKTLEHSEKDSEKDSGSASAADSDSETPIFVCTVCGFIEEDEAPANCPQCGAPAEKFVKP